MKLSIIASAAMSLAVAAAPTVAQAQVADKAAPSEPTWGPAPAVFPAGAQMAVMHGDPGSSGIFTVRLRFPAGYRIAPHYHPTDEYVTVISGSFRIGMGERVDLAKSMTMQVGDFMTVPAKEAHFAATQGMTVLQVTAMGPFALTYVNPADMPRQMDMPRTPEIPRPKPAP